MAQKRVREDAIQICLKRLGRPPLGWEIEEEMEAVKERRRRYRKSLATKNFLMSYHGKELT
jgi:hypothetical protein